MINGERKSGPKRQAFKGINLPIKVMKNQLFSEKYLNVLDLV